MSITELISKIEIYTSEVKDHLQDNPSDALYYSNKLIKLVTELHSRIDDYVEDVA